MICAWCMRYIGHVVGLCPIRYTWSVNVHDVCLACKSCTVPGLGSEKLGTIVMSSSADFMTSDPVPSAPYMLS